MNRVYNELCKVMITDKPKQEEEEINQPTLLSIHSLHEDFNQEESIQELLHQTDKHAQICPRHDVAGKMRMIHAWDFSNAGGR